MGEAWLLLLANAISLLVSQVSGNQVSFRLHSGVYCLDRVSNSWTATKGLRERSVKYGPQARRRARKNTIVVALAENNESSFRNCGPLNTSPKKGKEIDSHTFEQREPKPTTS